MILHKGMPLSKTWDGTNQHWVPQQLLRRFSIAKRDGRVYALNKRTWQVAVRRIEKIGSKTDLLTAIDNKRLTAIEARVERVLRDIRSGKLGKLQIEDRMAIDTLVFAMTVDNPYSGADKAKMRKEAIRDTAKQVAERSLLHGRPIDRPRLEERVAALIPQDYLSIALDFGEPLTIAALHLMGLTLHISKEPLVIGDAPVLFARSDIGGRPSLLNFGSEVLLPISSHHLLHYDWSTSTNVLTPEDGVIASRPNLPSEIAYYVGHLYSPPLP